jgi:hypothetical protein
LESWAVSGLASGDTSIFITPGFRFQVVDMLMTNFHLPKSTLLMLISAFAGYEPVMAACRHAIAQQYRFFVTATRCCCSAPPTTPHFFKGGLGLGYAGSSVAASCSREGGRRVERAGRRHRRVFAMGEFVVWLELVQPRRRRRRFGQVASTRPCRATSRPGQAEFTQCRGGQAGGLERPVHFRKGKWWGPKGVRAVFQIAAAKRSAQGRVPGGIRSEPEESTRFT